MDLLNLFQEKGKKLPQQAYCAYATTYHIQLIAEIRFRQTEWFK